jgi:hypothetical protein
VFNLHDFDFCHVFQEHNPGIKRELPEFSLLVLLNYVLCYIGISINI